MKSYPLPCSACLIISLLGTLLCFNARAVPTLKLDISPPTGANEYSRGASIEWEGERDLAYKIQSATTLGDASAWKTEDIVVAGSNGPVRWMAPEALSTAKYYRLLLPQPEISSVEPTWIDSSDSTALLYILGQLLPTNGFVVINGQVLTPIIINSNGVWAAISLNGLPPGEPIVTLTVMDSGSNVVATLPIQSPIFYGTELTLEQLQGPPEEPPAVVKTKTKSNQSNDRLGGGGGGGGGGIGGLPEPEMAQGKSTPVTRSNISNNRSVGGGGGGAGGLGGLPEPEMAQGKSTPVTRSNISNNRSADGGGGGGGIGALPQPEMAQGKSTQVTRSNISNNRSAGGSSSIAFASGELSYEETDLEIPAPGFDFAWTRTYRSRTGPTTSLGHGWDFSYNMRLSLQSDGTVQFCSGNGRCDSFYPNGTNGWSRDEFFMTIGDLNKDGIPDVVVCANGTRVTFNPLATGGAADKPVSMTDRNNNTMSFYYDGLGRLTTIVDTLGRTNVVGYNSSGLLASVTDFSGRVLSYEYDGNGDLVRCISPAVTGTPNGNDFPGGKTNSYTYSSGFGDERLNHNLISSTDGKGQTSLQVVYQPTNNPASIDFDAVAYMLRGIERRDIWRGRVTPSPTNGFATIQVIMRDAVGNVTECFFDSRQRCVRQIDYTGRSATNAPVTPLTNRPKNKLRSSDPNFYETEWQWNNDSLCRAMYANPRSISRQQYLFAYERDFNPQCSPRKRGDLRVLREYACCGGADLDGDGVLDVADRAWHFEYHPTFSSGNTRQRINDLEARLTALGLIVPEGNGVAIQTKGTGADKNRVAPISLGNGVAIQTKGTGADKNRVASIPLGSGVAIKTKGTGADKNRFANGPRQSIDLSGSYGGRILNWSAVRSSVQDIEKNTDFVKGEVCDDGNDCDDNDSFITSITDPRGNTATAGYDANGNCNILNPRAARDNFLQGAGDIAMRFAYNPRGQVVAITNFPDANGYRRVDTLDYYTNGTQSGYCARFVVDAAGPIVTVWNFEYDSRGNVTRLIVPRTNDWLFTWNQLDQLVERQTPDRGFGARTATTCAYDANDNLVRSETELRDATDTFQRNIAALYEYDSLDRLVSYAAQVSANQFVTNKFVYDANDNCIEVHSPLSVSGADPHNYLAYEYDERGLVFREITAPNSGQSGTNEWSYDERFHPATKKYVDAAENIMVATYTYDGFGRPETVTDAMGNVAAYAYDRNDNLVLCREYCETNDVPGGAGNLRYHEWHWVYDGRDRCIESRGSFFDPATQAPIGDGVSVTAYSYAPNSACIRVMDDNGHAILIGHDFVGRLSSVSDAKSNIVACAYDPNGNVVNITQTDRSDLTQTTQQFIETYGYDALDRCVRRVDNVGNTNRYVYDSLSRAVQAVTPNGNTAFSTYDDLSRCTLVVADMNGDGLPDLAADVNHSWTYDDNSRCISSTDDNTNTTSYAYDSCDRLVATTEADGTGCSLIWSPRSNLLRQQDANGTVISNSFDALGRCISRQITPGSGVATTTTFEHYTYDGLSQLTAASNDVSFVVIARDSLGNPGSANENGRTIRYTYDSVGNRTSITYPSGTAVGYTYDACDQVTQINRCEGCGNPWLGDLVATYAYEGPGRVGRITRANGVNTRVTWDGINGAPNASGDFGWQQVNGVNHQVAGGGAIIDRRTFTYDRNQNKIQRAQIAPFVPGGHMNTNQFAYDGLDRLTTFTRSAGTPGDVFKSYVLDGNGNRQFAFSNGLAQPYFMDQTPPPGAGDFQMNQYTSTPFGTQTFDENGNLSGHLSTAAQLQLQYDYANRLVAVNDLSGGFAAPLATFAYDGLGRRISKTVFPPLPLPPVTTEYVVDADCDGDPAPPLEIRVGGVAPTRFVLDGTRSHDDEVARLTGSGQPQYFHRDELGNVLALTDAAGSVIERYDYDDFGAPTFLTSDGIAMGTNASPAGNAMLFHGMEWEGEVGLYFGHSQGGTTGPILRSSSGELLWNNDPYAEDSMRTYDPFSGRYVMRAGVPLRFDAATAFAGNNPWSSSGETYLKLGTANGGIERPGCGSARVARNILKTYFQTGDVPTQGQFKFQHRQEYGQTLPEKRKL